jgi:hypothetical protein
VLDECRRGEQYGLTIQFFTDLKLLMQSEPNAEAIYKMFTGFARSYVSLYFEADARGRLDIRFKPLDYVCRKDHVHKAVCSHLRAYRIMRDVEPTSDSQFDHLSYSDVLVEFAREVVRIDEGEDGTEDDTA